MSWLRILTAAILLAGIAPAGCSKSEYDQRLEASQKLNDEALAIVKSRPMVQADIKKSLLYTGDPWIVSSDLETATKSEPWYCPNEYVVEYGDDHESADELVYRVDIKTHKVWRVENQSQADARAGNESFGSEHITACVDGTNPIQVDPDDIP